MLRQLANPNTGSLPTLKNKLKLCSFKESKQNIFRVTTKKIKAMFVI